jgi:hypothetical protein
MKHKLFRLIKTTINHEKTDENEKKLLNTRAKLRTAFNINVVCFKCAHSSL